MINRLKNQLKESKKRENELKENTPTKGGIFSWFGRGTKEKQNLLQVIKKKTLRKLRSKQKRPKSRFKRCFRVTLIE